MEGQRMLAKGYVMYLASIVDTTKKMKLEPSNVPVVYAFVDVFLEDLPRLHWIMKSSLKLNFCLEPYQF